MNIHQPCGNVMPFLSGCYSIFQLLCVQFIEPRSKRCLALSLPHSQKSLPSIPNRRKLYCGQVSWGFCVCCRQLLKLAGQSYLSCDQQLKAVVSRSNLSKLSTAAKKLSKAMTQVTAEVTLVVEETVLQSTGSSKSFLFCKYWRDFVVTKLKFGYKLLIQVKHPIEITRCMFLWFSLRCSSFPFQFPLLQTL